MYFIILCENRRVFFFKAVNNKYLNLLENNVYNILEDTCRIPYLEQ